MIIDEILPLTWPSLERPVPDEIRQRERDDRNTRNVLAWHCKVFGPVVGPQLVGDGFGVNAVIRPWRVEHWRGLTTPTKFEDFK